MSKVSPAGLNQDKTIADTTCDVPLLKDEKGGLMMEYGITTITFYKGDFTKTAKVLREQFIAVAKENPWICGHLAKTKPSGITLRHPAVIDDKSIDAVFHSVAATEQNIPKLSLNLPYTEMCSGMYTTDTFVVGTGYSLVGKNKPVTLLSIVEQGPSEFSLVFSMSHVIADGRTYYEVFQMLQPGVLPRALSTKRVMSFSESSRDAFGRREMEWADSVSANIMFTFTYMFAKPAKCFAFYLDDERLAKAKAEGAVGVDFVSTNDILTSAFFGTCGTSFGWMGFDCREKGLEGIGADLAGNYVTALVVDSEAFDTPAALRKIYTPGKPYETIKGPLPKCCCGQKLNLGMATNWSSFTGKMVLPEGCEMILHLPVQNPKYVSFDLMIPFACQVDSQGKVRKGVMCWTTNTSADELRKALPVGDSVSSTLFPSM